MQSRHSSPDNLALPLVLGNKTSTFIRAAFSLIIFFVLASPFFVHAGEAVECNVEERGLQCAGTTARGTGSIAGFATGDENTDQSGILIRAVGVFVQGILGFLGITFLILMIYAGYQWMTAGGNDEQVTKAKGLITNAVIGLIVVLGSYMIYMFIGGQLGL